MEIRRYTKDDESCLMGIIKAEGEDWECYSADGVSEKYKRALADSITYVAYEGEDLCGYSRSLKDGDFCIWICDLLVTGRYRERKIGQRLMEQLCVDYPEHTVYVLSGVDGYYIKKGYHREGSIFKVKL